MSGGMLTLDQLSLALTLSGRESGRVVTTVPVLKPLV